MFKKKLGFLKILWLLQSHGPQRGPHLLWRRHPDLPDRKDAGTNQTEDGRCRTTSGNKLAPFVTGQKYCKFHS